MNNALEIFNRLMLSRNKYLIPHPEWEYPFICWRGGTTQFVIRYFSDDGLFLYSESVDPDPATGEYHDWETPMTFEVRDYGGVRTEVRLLHGSSFRYKATVTPRDLHDGSTPPAPFIVEEHGTSGEYVSDHYEPKRGIVSTIYKDKIYTYPNATINITCLDQDGNELSETDRITYQKKMTRFGNDYSESASASHTINAKVGHTYLIHFEKFRDYLPPEDVEYSVSYAGENNITVVYVKRTAYVTVLTKDDSPIPQNVGGISSFTGGTLQQGRYLVDDRDRVSVTFQDVPFYETPSVLVQEISLPTRANPASPSYTITGVYHLAIPKDAFFVARYNRTYNGETSVIMQMWELTCTLPSVDQYIYRGYGMGEDTEMLISHSDGTYTIHCVNPETQDVVAFDSSTGIEGDWNTLLPDFVEYKDDPSRGVDFELLSTSIVLGTETMKTIELSLALKDNFGNNMSEEIECSVFINGNNIRTIRNGSSIQLDIPTVDEAYFAFTSVHVVFSDVEGYTTPAARVVGLSDVIYDDESSEAVIEATYTKNKTCLLSLEAVDFRGNLVPYASATLAYYEGSTRKTVTLSQDTGEMYESESYRTNVLVYPDIEYTLTVGSSSEGYFIIDSPETFTPTGDSDVLKITYGAYSLRCTAVCNGETLENVLFQIESTDSNYPESATVLGGAVYLITQFEREESERAYLITPMSLKDYEAPNSRTVTISSYEEVLEQQFEYRQYSIAVSVVGNVNGRVKIADQTGYCKFGSDGEVLRFGNGNLTATAIEIDGYTVESSGITWTDQYNGTVKLTYTENLEEEGWDVPDEDGKYPLRVSIQLMNGGATRNENENIYGTRKSHIGFYYGVDGSYTYDEIDIAYSDAITFADKEIVLRLPEGAHTISLSMDGETVDGDNSVNIQIPASRRVVLRSNKAISDVDDYVFRATYTAEGFDADTGQSLATNINGKIDFGRIQKPAVSIFSGLVCAKYYRTFSTGSNIFTDETYTGMATTCMWQYLPYDTGNVFTLSNWGYNNSRWGFGLRIEDGVLKFYHGSTLLWSGEIQTGKWNHFAFTHDDESQETRLYINGKREFQGSFVKKGWSQTQLHINQFEKHNEDIPDAYYADARVYGRMLNDLEIEKIYRVLANYIK